MAIMISQTYINCNTTCFANLNDHFLLNKLSKQNNITFVEAVKYFTTSGHMGILWREGITQEITPSYTMHIRAFGTYLLGGLFTLQKRL